MVPLYRCGSTAPTLDYEEAVYFLPLSSQKFLVVILSTLGGWKAESDWESSALTTRPLLQWKTSLASKKSIAFPFKNRYFLRKFTECC